MPDNDGQEARVNSMEARSPKSVRDDVPRRKCGMPCEPVSADGRQRGTIRPDCIQDPARLPHLQGILYPINDEPAIEELIDHCHWKTEAAPLVMKAKGALRRHSIYCTRYAI
jgi:hypothetical protein